MQDLVGTALRRVHLAVRSPRDASISRMPNKWWVFLHPQASDPTLNAVILH